MDPRHYGFSQFANTQSSFGESFISGGVSDEHLVTSENQEPISEQPQPESSSVKRSSVRTSSFTNDEDLMLIHAWINISTDPVTGSDQRRDQFWKRIYDFYHTYKRFVSDRTQKSLTQRWSTIQLAVSKFQAYYVQIENRRQSGVNEQDKIENAKKLYCSLQKVITFNFMHCWNELRNQPKWKEEIAEKTSKKQKSHSSASPGSSSPSTPNLAEEEEGFVELPRPPGRKAEKVRRGKSKSFLQGGDRDIPLISMFEKMQEKKLDVYKQSLATDVDRIAVDKERIASDNARIALDKAKFEAEQAATRAADEERIMMIDCEKLPHNQAVYYAARQREILARTLGS